MPTTDQTRIAAFSELVASLRRANGFSDVVRALRAQQSAAIDGTWGSACALSVCALAEETSAPILVVLPRIADVDDFALDIAGFREISPPIFPAWETKPAEYRATDAIFGSRLRVLNALGDRRPPQIIVTSFPALLQPVPGRNERRKSTRKLRVGDELNLDEFLGWLVNRGFERVNTLEYPGEFSLHGGILDIFPPDAFDPLRVEFFGDEIESIRRFSVETQRKLEELDEAVLTLLAAPHSEAGPHSETEADSLSIPDPKHNGTATVEAPPPTADPEQSQHDESLLDSLPGDTWIALVELPELVDEGRSFLNRLNDPRGLFGVDAILSRCANFSTVHLSTFGSDAHDAHCRLQIESIERFSGPKTEVLNELASVVGRDERVLIACHNEGERKRLAELLAESELPIQERIELCLGSLTRGFRLVSERLIVLSDHELFGRTELRRVPRKRRPESRAIDSFLELNEGDLVVHLTNGIGRYRGMKLLEKEHQVEEHLVLEFRNRVLIYVPVSLIHLVQKYVGAAKTAPELSKIGSSAWSKKKQKVAQAVMDMASDMIRLQAERESKPGIAYPPDTHWMHEFEAAFPYTETDDQLNAIVDLKEDMLRSRPMDRLICGDVGYGKTEVAMRAAFKALDAGKQVAVLVPTTVLAEQHFRTFTQRMAEFPFTIEALSRFKTKAEQRQILAGMEAGSVDLVIGTHRLVQKDVRFKDLGLLIIDEEQRFGVDAKEMLKRMRLEVDVLTLSATPIPRTLHMSLLGIRDISNLETAPQDRMAVETRISRFDSELIRMAIVRELNRGGQVYFVHNRVYNIQSIAERIRQIVPEAEVDVAHGQMGEHQLEEAMLKFVSGKTDVLVCTTIIESGLDIPNANTIFIHQADRYGLADLHQLRGRVGRYRHRAYCYLLLEEGRLLTSTAAKRLKAIEEFSDLGAGFKISMRDLEIRGAGNILGTEQSGHIATVGYELYCQLLEKAVRVLKREPLRDIQHVAVDLPVSAYLPDSFVPAGRQKIDLYRKLSHARTFEHLSEIADELRDRFGPLPEEAERLLAVRELQLFAHQWQIDQIRLEGKYAVFGYRNPNKIQRLAKLRGSKFRIVDHRDTYFLLPKRQLTENELIAQLKSVLQP